jgi:hypothetical protein
LNIRSFNLPAETVQPVWVSCRALSEQAPGTYKGALKVKADELGCHIDRRGDGEWNILPFGVDKGTTLGRYVVEENLAPNAVIAIAEHTGDDCLFGRGWRGAVFAHADGNLKEFGDRFHNVTVLEKSGAAGVLDALRAQGWLELAK